jgi:hypothetical protein
MSNTSRKTFKPFRPMRSKVPPPASTRIRGFPSMDRIAKTSSPQRVRPVAGANEKETKLDAAFHATLK